VKAVTAREMREIDRVTIQELGLPGGVLMGFAGKAVADEIAAHLPRARRIAVFSGTGNNGGDGFVTAWFLACRGLTVEVFCAGPVAKISGDARIFYDLCVRGGIPVIELAGDNPSMPDCDAYDCIVDALLGTGSSGRARGIVEAVIRHINDADAFVVSIDLPSGLGADGEAPEGEVVVADLTVTIGLPKISLVTWPGRSFVGTLRVADIGFPPSLTASGRLATEMIDADFFRTASIPHIEAAYAGMPDAHKGDRGRLLLVGGFDGMEGAILMSARAAFETGIGMGTLVTTPRARIAIAGQVPELITREIPPMPDKDAICDAFAEIMRSSSFGAMVIGPGLGRSELSAAAFEAALNAAADVGLQKVLVDGDGLFHLSRAALPQIMDLIVTPHFMEASRLIDMPVEEIRNNRHRAAGICASRFSCTALLKGPASIVSDGARYAVNTTGTAALATAGSGDVLSGIIGALLLRPFNAFTAAATGAWLHGKAAEIIACGRESMLIKATDLLEGIRPARDLLLKYA